MTWLLSYNEQQEAQDWEKASPIAAQVSMSRQFPNHTIQSWCHSGALWSWGAEVAEITVQGSCWCWGHRWEIEKEKTIQKGSLRSSYKSVIEGVRHWVRHPDICWMAAAMKLKIEHCYHRHCGKKSSSQRFWSLYPATITNYTP